jgi:hypothetical protein
MTVDSSVLAGTLGSSIATAEVSLSNGVSIISAQADITISQGASAPLVIGGIRGDPIETVRVAAVYGGDSLLTYITASGRKIPGL